MPLSVSYIWEEGGTSFTRYLKRIMIELHKQISKNIMSLTADLYQKHNLELNIWVI